MFLPRSILIAAALIMGQRFAVAQTVVNSTYLGQCQGVYSDPNCWSPPEVPANTSSAQYNVTIGPGSVVSADVDATISNLFLSGYLAVTGKSFTVTNSTTFEVSALYANISLSGFNGPAFFDAGTLTAFSGGTLRGRYRLEDGGNGATLQFNGAAISTLSEGSLQLYGPLVNIVDEDGTGALGHLARIESSAALTLALRDLTTSAPFTNLGTVTLGDPWFGDTLFIATAGLTNFDPATRTLARGTFQLGVKDFFGYVGDGGSEFRFANADVINNGSTIRLIGHGSRFADLAGNDGLRNLAHNLPSGALTFDQHDFVTVGPFANDGSLTLIASEFTITGAFDNFDSATGTLNGGTYSITFGGTLKFAGADIVHNAASILVSISKITDLVGNDGLRNFKDNLAAGSFTVGKGQLFVAPGNFTNAGRLETIHSHPAIHQPIWESGEFRVPAGSGYTQTAGSTVNGGIFTAQDINIAGGSFSGAGAIKGNLTVSNGTVFPGGTIDGNLTLGSNARVHSTIAQYSTNVWSQITGAASVGGTLEIELAGSLFPGSNDVITLVQSMGPLTGTFGNAPNGTRIATTDGSGSFVVLYEANKVKLTAFQASPLPAQLLNISTRAYLSRADDDPYGDRAVLIGGFIVSGADSKKVVVRGLGPSLGKGGVSPTLTDPTLELHAPDGTTIAANDNWKETQQSDLVMHGLAPEDDRESALITTLTPGTYTVVIREKDGLAGSALVEIYDVSGSSDSKLANISTRGFTDGTNVLIGGIIAAGDGQANGELVVRAIGPELRRHGIRNAVDDPTLELRDANGALVAFNDDWVSKFQSIPGELQPHFSQESALRLSLPRGNYTALVRAKTNSGGVALVEFYDLRR